MGREHLFTMIETHWGFLSGKLRVHRSLIETVKALIRLLECGILTAFAGYFIKQAFLTKRLKQQSVFKPYKVQFLEVEFPSLDLDEFIY